MPQEGATATNRRTGERAIFQGGQWVKQVAGKLTEDQGKAATYGRLMSTAEKQYQESLRQGYKPDSLRNAAAGAAEHLHVPGFGEPLAGLAPVIRDDASDRGHAAEQLWQDAQLKAMSGAASPEPEVERNRSTYFPHMGDGAAAPQMADSRRAAYDAARERAGPAGRTLPAYPAEGGDIPVMSPEQAAQLAPGTRFKTTDGRVLVRK